jgi:hypothetical protein
MRLLSEDILFLLSISTGIEEKFLNQFYYLSFCSIMNFLLKLNTCNRHVTKTNEGVKHESYARVLQDRRKCAFKKLTGKKLKLFG